MKKLTNLNFLSKILNKNMKTLKPNFYSINSKNFRNLYDIFDLPDFFDDDKEIKRMYMLLGSRWHPRRNVNMYEYAAKRFSELSKAYEILADKEKKFEYDKLLSSETNEDKFKSVLKPFNTEKQIDYYDKLFDDFLRKESMLFNDDFFKKIDKEYNKHLEKSKVVKENIINSDKTSPSKTKNENEKKENTKSENSKNETLKCEKIDNKSQQNQVKENQQNKNYYKSVKSNIVIKNGKRLEKKETVIIEENGDKKTIIEEIADDGKKSIKTEYVHHDKDGNLIKEITIDDGKNKSFTEQKMLALNDKNVNENKI